jgi:hypothetical protein
VSTEAEYTRLVEKRLERITRNEALFRSVNERIEEFSRGVGDDRVEFLCECGRDGCETRIWLTPKEYEAAHGQDDRFVLAPGHEAEEIERVVERHESYWVVDKLPEAEAILRDPQR